MFDVSFSELALIGIIALIVLGPERLPKVARTVGHLLGRAQRYVNDVKTDIQREMDLDELKNLKGQMEDAAKSVKSSMQDAADSLKTPLDEAQQALKDASASVGNLTDSIKADIKESSEPGQTFVHPELTEPPAEPAAEAAAPDTPNTASEAPSAADPNTLPLPGFDDTTKTKTGTPT